MLFLAVLSLCGIAFIMTYFVFIEFKQIPKKEIEEFFKNLEGDK